MDDDICNVSWFDERDIDVWLAEELRVNEYFCRWFLSKLGKNQGLLMPAYKTRVSVMDQSGRESDVEALFRTTDGATFAVLIENKIKAAFQPDQMADYLRRAERGVREGRWVECSVATLAPGYRNLAVPPEVTSLTFEEVANCLLDVEIKDARLVYRSQFLTRASQKSIFVTETENPFVREWWIGVDEMAKREFGDFFIIDRRRFPKTTYVNLRCSDMPSYLRLDLKGNQGIVALAFIGFNEVSLKSVISMIGSKVAEVVTKRGQDPTLLVGNLGKFEISDGAQAIDGPVRDAYKVAHKLLQYWKENRVAFDGMSARLRSS